MKKNLVVLSLFSSEEKSFWFPDENRINDRSVALPTELQEVTGELEGHGFDSSWELRHFFFLGEQAWKPNFAFIDFSQSYNIYKRTYNSARHLSGKFFNLIW